MNLKPEVQYILFISVANFTIFVGIVNYRGTEVGTGAVTKSENFSLVLVYVGGDFGREYNPDLLISVEHALLVFQDLVSEVVICLQGTEGSSGSLRIGENW